MIFGIVSDLHFHNWSAFSHTDSTGLNSRLAILLAEVERAASEVQKAGGTVLFVTGDVFHVRGSVAPSVLNPVRDLFRMITKVYALKVVILAGNHDLEGKHANRLGSAVTALELPDDHANIGVVTVSGNPCTMTLSDATIALVPWCDNQYELRGQIEGTSGDILLMHAPINNVIRGIPDTGLDPGWLHSLGRQAIFSGHYHNHKEFPGNVFSVGAIAHHSWSDIGTKAGFILVEASSGKTPNIKFFASHAPSFVDLDPDMGDAEMALAADGNYVRARVKTADQREVTAIREALLEAGARGVTLIPDATGKTVAREATSIKKGMTLAESVEGFIDAGAFNDKPALKALSAKILQQVETV